MTEALAHVPLPKTLQNHFVYESIKQECEQKLRAIPNAKDAFKQSYPFVKLVCQMVEELVPAGNSSPKGMKLNKKQMALDILTDVLELSQLDAAQAARSIDVVIEAGIKRVSFWRKAGRYFFSILLCQGTPPLLLPESAEE